MDNAKLMSVIIRNLKTFDLINNVETIINPYDTIYEKCCKAILKFA